MGLLNLIGFSGAGAKNTETELPDVFPFPTQLGDFVDTDLKTIYARVLTDVLERTQNIPDEKKTLLWDNCLASEKSDGLVTLIAKAMVNKADLFVVYDKATNVVREANNQEATQIRAEYKDKAKSAVGVFITFKNFKKTDMLKIYSALEYWAVAGLHKSMNLSVAMQFKMHDLRGSVSGTDAAAITAQAQAVAEAFKKGRGAVIDAKDIIEMAKPDLTATNSAMDFINQKRSFYLGLPASYITGESAKGLGDSGEGEAKAVERGLKGYYFSIIKPVVEALFGIKTEFESEDYSQISSALETLKTFELTADDFLEADDKRDIIRRMFGLPPAKGSMERDVTTTPPASVPAPGNEVKK